MDSQHLSFRQPDSVRENEPTPAETPERASNRGAETVLVVEDEELVRRLGCRMLRSFGYTVLEAGTGDEALVTAAQYEGPIHILLADVVLPQMSGPQLAERLRLSRPAVKVLFMSGYAAETVGSPVGPASDAAFIQKPFSQDELQRKVREVLDAQG